MGVVLYDNPRVPTAAMLTSSLWCALETQTQCFPHVPAESGVARRVGGSENLARLREVKMQYDPDNLFRNHHFTGLMDTDKAL